MIGEKEGSDTEHRAERGRLPEDGGAFSMDRTKRQRRVHSQQSNHAFCTQVARFSMQTGWDLRILHEAAAVIRDTGSRSRRVSRLRLALWTRAARVKPRPCHVAGLKCGCELRRHPAQP